MRKPLASKSLVVAALVAALSGIGGTGHAAPQIAAYASFGDRGAGISPGRCGGEVGADRAACRKLEDMLAGAHRDAALDALSRDWRGPRLVKFARLAAAEQAFAHALAANESGATPGSTAVADMEQAQNDAFVATLQRLVAGRLSGGADSFAATDESLNDAYGRVMKVDNTDELGWGDVKKTGILRTERAWITYRDAFVAFAATLDASQAADAVKCELTRQRTASLDAFLGD